jgi:hypothetical protein
MGIRRTIQARLLVAVASILAACGGGGTPAPTAPTGPSVPIDTIPSRAVETFDYVLVLLRGGYDVSGPTFTTTDGGPVDVTATFSPVAGFSFEIDLLYLGLEPPHNEGNGGEGASGPGPKLVGHWEVGYVGAFRARIYPLGARIPLPVPREGLRIPVTFTVEHP